MLPAVLSLESWSRTLRNQARVVWALILREIMTMYGRTKLGYLWVFVRIIIGMAIWYIIRGVIIGRETPWPDMHLLVFLASGYIIFFMFSDCVMKIMSAERGNKGLLDYPLVQPLDIVLSRVLLIGATNLLAGAVVLFLVYYVMGIEFYITSLGPILAGIFMALLLGTGVGLVCMVLDKFIPSTFIVVGFIMRILFITSGAIIVIDQRFPYELRKYVYLNPMYQIIEMARTGLSRILDMQAANVSLSYLTWWILISLFLGLLFERATRGMTEVSA